VRISSSFSIPAPPHEVFDRFLDPETMKNCIPGCHELEWLDESHYQGLLVNEVAHVRFNARFAAEIVEMDRPRLVRAVLTGEDRRLGSSLKLTASLGVEPDGDSDSAVSYEMDLALWGKLGRLGEPIIRRRSAEVERDFVTAFKTAFAPEPQPAMIGVGTEMPPSLSPSASVGQSAAARTRTSGRRMLLVVLQKLRVRMDRWIEVLG